LDTKIAYRMTLYAIFLTYSPVTVVV
jgi:hypothetical protein